METKPKVMGYRELTKVEIDLMNEVKAKAEEVGAMVSSLMDTPGIDPRWVAIATTQLQQGFMALNRAIAQPTTF